MIDDFGRQRMSIDELLNRWIVPLEKRYDFLNLPNGKKIQVPFDQLIVFSTNLEPSDLVDEAFLRRIPYKIEVIDPTEEEFRELFRLECPKMGIEYDERAIDYLIEKHYKRSIVRFRTANHEICCCRFGTTVSIKTSRYPSRTSISTSPCPTTLPCSDRRPVQDREKSSAVSSWLLPHRA